MHSLNLVVTNKGKNSFCASMKQVTVHSNPLKNVDHVRTFGYVFLQANFPALCRNNSGSTRLLGKQNQMMDIHKPHLTVPRRCIVSNMALVIIIPPDLSINTPKIMMMV